MDTLVSVCLGFGLSAACGFRVFVPMLFISLAANSDVLTLGPRFGWIASTPALIALAVATLLEIGAYYIPWLDHLLDTVASPAAVVAGIVASASVITGMDPYLKWTLAVIAGGGIAGSVQALTTGVRGASTLTTAGFGNPIVSTLEAGGSIFYSILAIVAPLVATFLVFVFILVAVNLATRRRRNRKLTAPSGSPW
ncbi:MAG: DUF4126 domain-containing protein [Acidobacteriota bacterium]|nr:DUF4126 domain-containing protein [Acidobacteriota bacterium]